MKQGEEGRSMTLYEGSIGMKSATQSDHSSLISVMSL